MGWQWWLSQLFASISLVFLVISFQQSTSKKILKFKMFSTFAALIGTIFLGNISAVILCAVGAYRNMTVLYFAYHPTTPKKVEYGTRISVVIMLIFFNLLFWVNYTSILSIILGLLCLLTYIQRHPEKIRRYALIAHVMGIIYYIILVSPMNITIEVFGMTSVIIGICRLDIVKFDSNFSIKFLGYYDGLKSMYVDDIKDYKDYVHIKSDIIDDGIWNFVYTSSDDIDNIFNKSRSLFVDRTPRVYVLSKSISSQKLEKYLQRYSTYCVDSWFCNDLSKIKLKLRSDFDLEIGLCEDKDVIINTIMEGFSTGDPNDPYGDLSPTYKESLEKKLSFGNTVHLVAKYKGNVAGLASCTLKDGTAYLNNVTTLKQYKGHGIAKEVILNMVKLLKERDIKQIIFATEKNAYTEIFYKKLGFTVVEYGYCLEEK